MCAVHRPHCFSSLVFDTQKEMCLQMVDVVVGGAHANCFLFLWLLESVETRLHTYDLFRSLRTESTLSLAINVHSLARLLAR